MADDVFRDGQEAETLLNNATLTKAMARVEDGYIAQWKIAKTAEDREFLSACVRAIGDVRGKLEAMKGAKTMQEAEDRRYQRAPKR